MNMHSWPRTNVYISSSVVNKYYGPLLFKASLNAKSEYCSSNIKEAPTYSCSKVLKKIWSIVTSPTFYILFVWSLPILAAQLFVFRLSNCQCQKCQIWLKIHQLSNLALKTYFFGLREKNLPPHQKDQKTKGKDILNGQVLFQQCWTSFPIFWQVSVF